jgi:hypothetical protein
MQPLSDLISNWQSRVHAESKSSLLASAYQRLSEPASLLEYERTHREELDQVLHRYSRSKDVHESSLSDEMMILLHIRVHEGVFYGKHLAESGFGQTKKKADEWIRFLSIDSWYEVLIHKWRFEYKKHYGI